MPTEYFDASFAEAATLLLKLLGMTALTGLAAGILTLPIFFAELILLRVWFWSLEARGPALLVRWGVPAASLASTVFLASYFGAFDAAGLKLGFTERARVHAVFDETTRAAGLALVPRTPWELPVFQATRGAVDPLIPSQARQTAEFLPPTSAEGELEKDRQERAKGPTSMFRLLIMLSLLIVGPFPTLVIGLTAAGGRKGVVLILRSLTRNLLRTSLTYLAVFVLAFVVSSIWTTLGFLSAVTTEKESNLKAIITERYQIPSMMKPTHVAELKKLIEELPPEQRPKNGDDDLMTWAFVGGSLDPNNRTFENMVFLFCMEPHKILTMMDGLDELTGEQQEQLRIAVEIMERNPKAVLIGKERLRNIKKRVGDRITLTSFNYPGLVFEFEVIGEFPEGRYDQSAAMNRNYLDRSIQAYEGTTGKAHPNADKSLNLIWLRLPNRAAFEALAAKVNAPGHFSPAVKMETASSAVNAFMEPFKDVLFFLRMLLVPALLASMVLVISITVTISVRERRTEMAVLKVLGFRPWMVLCLVLGESVLLGAVSGFLATASAYTMINAIGGIPFPIAFFPKFFVPAEALWWGPAVGGLAAIVGSVMPSLSAQSVKVSEVFSKVA